MLRGKKAEGGLEQEGLVVAVGNLVFVLRMVSREMTDLIYTNC